MKFSIFAFEKNLCILHGRVFVMELVLNSRVVLFACITDIRLPRSTCIKTIKISRIFGFRHQSQHVATFFTTGATPCTKE